MARLLDGYEMAVVCRELGITRKTGQKIFNRHKEFGLLAAIRTNNGVPFASSYALFESCLGAPRQVEHQHSEEYSGQPTATGQTGKAMAQLFHTHPPG